MSSGVRVSGFKGPLLELRTTSALMSVSLRSSAESGRILKSDEMGNDAEGISEVLPIILFFKLVGKRT